VVVVVVVVGPLVIRLSNSSKVQWIMQQKMRQV